MRPATTAEWERFAADVAEVVSRDPTPDDPLVYGAISTVEWVHGWRLNDCLDASFVRGFHDWPMIEAWVDADAYAAGALAAIIVHECYWGRARTPRRSGT